jgi:hypothetical protein
VQLEDAGSDISAAFALSGTSATLRHISVAKATVVASCSATALHVSHTEQFVWSILKELIVALTTVMYVI